MKDLSGFCHEGIGRYDMGIPFVIDGYEYFTDGRICVRRLTESTNTDRVSPDLNGLFSLIDATPLEKTIDMPCRSGNNCFDCGGDKKGVVYCENCDNSVETGHPCKTCEGTGKRYKNMEITGVYLGGHYLAKITKLLDNPKFVSLCKGFEDQNGPAYFTFDGGEGVLMPMRRDD